MDLLGVIIPKDMARIRGPANEKPGNHEDFLADARFERG